MCGTEVFGNSQQVCESGQDASVFELPVIAFDNRQ